MSDEEARDTAPEGKRSDPPEEKAEADAKAAAKAKAEAAAAARAKKAAEEAAKPPWERDPKAPEASNADDDALVSRLRQEHGNALAVAMSIGDDLVITVTRDEISSVCTSMLEAGYRLLVDICGADYPDREGARFEVVYHLYSLKDNRRVRLKVRVGENQEVPSVTGVWRGANWCEREVYDMYGIRFSGHPDMTRILMWEGFHGHPLRKDFPVEGVDTGAAIYPEYYEDVAGPITGTGTGWMVPELEAEAGDEGDEA